jgi:hypothetical protein
MRYPSLHDWSSALRILDQVRSTLAEQAEEFAWLHSSGSATHVLFSFFPLSTLSAWRPSITHPLCLGSH